jgi:hypothetical protein
LTGISKSAPKRRPAKARSTPACNPSSRTSLRVALTSGSTNRSVLLTRCVRTHLTLYRRLGLP